MKIPCGYFLKDFTNVIRESYLSRNIGFYNYFSKFLHVQNQEIKLNMPKNYGINIFYYEDPLSLTHTVLTNILNLCKFSVKTQN